MTSKAVLDYWFGEIREDPKYLESRNVLWFGGGKSVDEDIAKRFGPLLESILQRKNEDWTSQPLGRLATIVVLDQFSRNIFRGTPRAFAADPIALKLAKEGVDANVDRLLHPVHRIFFYLPFEHSEVLKDQEQGIGLYSNLAKGAPAPIKESIEDNFTYAVRHFDIIKRFGRFPHRNAILGRPSTPEEIEFLKQPGSSF